MLRYADRPDAVVDVYLPPSSASPSSPCPLVVLLHGGFWRAEYDRTHLRPLAEALRQQDVVVAVPEFRRIGGRAAGGRAAGGGAGGGEWPVIGSDVETALHGLAQRVEEVAPRRVDPGSPYLLAGHSAGGHLALWAGLRSGATRVRRIVALAPVSDLAAAAQLRLGDDAVVELLGGTPRSQPARYTDADPLRLLPGDVPVTLIHGIRDDQVPVSLSRAVASTHPEIDYIELPDVEHFALIDPLSAACRETVLPVLTAHVGC